MASTMRLGTDSGNSAMAFQHAVNNNIQIVNNSYGRPLPIVGTYAGNENIFYRLDAPYFKNVIDAENDISGVFKSTFRQYNTIAENADIIFVWSAGNGGWFYDPTNNVINDARRFSMCGFTSVTEAFAHDNSLDGRECPTESINRIIDATQQDLFDNVVSVDENGDRKDVFVDDEISRNDPGGYALAPIYERDLFGKWLVVGATREDNTLASFSNGCGITKFWCLVAPGSNLRYGPSITSTVSGTSFSAPLLAVLWRR
ncbi:MAG: S8 family serine peptidase [Gammaproteobacteria bacterium WSBS_2016_MAG_OTU1]